MDFADHGPKLTDFHENLRVAPYLFVENPQFEKSSPTSLNATTDREGHPPSFLTVDKPLYSSTTSWNSAKMPAILNSLSLDLCSPRLSSPFSIYAVPIHTSCYTSPFRSSAVSCSFVNSNVVSHRTLWLSNEFR
jgi:hypothetical protein